MSFMEAQITGLEEWVVVDTSEGVTFVPNDIVGLDEESVASLRDQFDATDLIPDCVRDYVGGRRLMEPIELRSGYGVRASAPGYMDCTEWDIFDTEEEAREALEELQWELDGCSDEINEAGHNDPGE